LEAELSQLKQFNFFQGRELQTRGGPKSDMAIPSKPVGPAGQLSIDTTNTTPNKQKNVVGVRLYENEQGIPTLGTARDNDFNAFRPLPQIRQSALNPISMVEFSPNVPPRAQGRGNLVSDDYQTGIDFVLQLEHPCMPHVHPDRLPHMIHNATDPNGHVLTASISLIQQYDDPNGVKPGASWTVTPNEIERLLHLSSSLRLEGEITPVEAWKRISSHPGFASLSQENFEAMKGELKALVTCYGFGAAMDEYDYENIVDRYLASGQAF